MINTILSKLLAFWKTGSDNEPITIEINESEDTTENYLNKID